MNPNLTCDPSTDLTKRSSSRCVVEFTLKWSSCSPDQKNYLLTNAASVNCLRLIGCEKFRENLLLSILSIIFTIYLAVVIIECFKFYYSYKDAKRTLDKFWRRERMWWVETAISEDGLHLWEYINSFLLYMPDIFYSSWLLRMTENIYLLCLLRMPCNFFLRVPQTNQGKSPWSHCIVY